MHKTETTQLPSPAAADKVRVSFFECKKPLAVTSPEPPDLYGSSLYDFNITMTSPTLETALPPALDRQLSNGNGHDNPFRPDGDISREADEIVQKIKSGQSLDVSITHPPTSNSTNSPDGDNLSGTILKTDDSFQISAKSSPIQLQQSPTKVKECSPLKNSKAGANGSAPGPENSASPGPVEVKHVIVTPSDPAQVEHVVLKKKKKCECCVIQ